MKLLARLKKKASALLYKVLLSADAKAVRADKLTYLHPPKIRRLERLALRAMKTTDGCLMEFGVALGGSAILLAKQARLEQRQFHGFDVFDMIPAPTSDKDGEGAKARYEVIASKQSVGIGGQEYYGYRSDLYGDVCRAFDKHGIPVDGAGVQLHRGLFENTLASFPQTTIAFAHVDCDWYDPVKLCLSEIDARSSVGTIILLDDYHHYDGCKTATTEFLQNHPNYRLEDGPNVALVRVE